MLKFGDQQQQQQQQHSSASNTFGATPTSATSSMQFTTLQPTMMQLPQSSAVQQQQPTVYTTLQQHQQQMQLPLDGTSNTSISSSNQLHPSLQQQRKSMHTTTGRSTPDIVVSSSKDGATNNVIPVIPDHIQQHVTNREALSSSSLTPLPSSSSSSSSSSSTSSSSTSSTSLSSVHTSPQHQQQGFPTTSSSTATTTTKHKRNNWKNKPKYCQHCNFYFELSQSHCPKCHKITQVKLKCPYCDDRWEYYTKMSTHLKNKHKNQQESAAAPEKTATHSPSPQTTSTAPPSASASSVATTSTSPPQKDASNQQQLHDNERTMLSSASEHPPDLHALSSAAIILQSAIKQASLQQQHTEQVRQQQPAQLLPAQPQLQPQLQPQALPIPPKIKISTARRNVHARNAEPVFKDEQMQPAMTSPMSPIRKKRKTVVRSDTRHKASSDTAQQQKYSEDASDTLLNFDEALNDTSGAFDFPIFDSSPFLSPFNYIAMTSPPAPASSPVYSPTRSSYSYQQIAKKLFGPPTDEDINMKLNREYDTDSSSESHEDDTHGKDNRLTTSLFDLNLEDQDILDVLKPTNLFDRHDFDDDQSVRSRVIIAETPREEERWI